MILLAAGFCAAKPRRAIENADAKAPQVFVGLDRNEYPGDAALAELKKRFTFSGYWLSPPPGEKSNSWKGKRDAVNKAGFGFLLLFDGKLEKELPSVAEAQTLGKIDGARAAESADDEGFAKGAVIFLDQEEGGRLSPVQLAYILAWMDAVASSGFRGGIYCSGVPVRESKSVSVLTAQDLRSRAGQREISYFVFNDVCPPSPGCRIPSRLPAMSASGVKFAEIWQYAQTPREKPRTIHCAATYAKDGNCYPPGMQASGLYVDLNLASSADPSHARK
ncbi:MAG TPA: glycoside hydrolase domain-containing protein [Candidatus Acidoferrales bacterium]|nr:glycoside hydrolase domain-containing protein [Candidatus Acidoferrales bacterium]